MANEDPEDPVLAEIKRTRERLLAKLREVDEIEREHSGELGDAPLKVKTPSLEDILAEPDVPTSWLVENVLSHRAIGMLVAEAYMSKSTWAASLALHIASGRDFLGWRIPEARPVLYWQTEGSVSRFKYRISAAANYYGIEIKGLPLYLERSGLGEDFRSPAFAAVAERARGGLVIADTSGAFYFGDENSAEEVRAGWIRPLKAVSVSADVACVTVHHHGKPSKEREGHQKGRGSSALYGDMDTWIRIENVPGVPTQRQLIVDKVREAMPPAPLDMEFIADRAAFAPVSQVDREQAEEDEENRAVFGYAARFEEVVAAHPGWTTKQVEELAGACRKETRLAARKHLLSHERVRVDGRKGATLTWFKE